ncbi:MAG: sodium ion-translocating decarboxylase subunit beta [Clostridia bacterium]|nr:sodium ion-translocating decarboxylase subunit beta [Clostridia bacterium]
MRKTGLCLLAALGVVLAVIGYGAKNRYAASIGIIGGADGPTAIFIAGKTGAMLYAGTALLLAAMILLAAGIWKRRK